MRQGGTRIDRFRDERSKGCGCAGRIRLGFVLAGRAFAQRWSVRGGQIERSSQSVVLLLELSYSLFEGLINISEGIRGRASEAGAVYATVSETLAGGHADGDGPRDARRVAHGKLFVRLLHG